MLFFQWICKGERERERERGRERGQYFKTGFVEMQQSNGSKFFFAHSKEDTHTLFYLREDKIDVSLEKEKFQY